MGFKILTLKDHIEWDRCINLLPKSQQDIYYRPEYYKLYEEYGDGEAMCFQFKKGKGIAIYPFLLNSVNKLGYILDDEYFDIQGAYGYNGVISNDNSPEFINSFYEQFDIFCREHNIIAEFTRFNPLLKNQDFSSSFRNIILDRQTIYVDLAKAKEQIFSDFQTSTRKQIRRCIARLNITIEIKINDITYLDDFINIYNESMHRVNAIKHLHFNREYFKHLFLSNSTYQIIAIHNNQPVGIITSIAGEDTLHGHLGGTLNTFVNSSVYSVLYWEMIKLAKERKFKYLHVGGGATTDSEDALLKYKKHFSKLMLGFYIGKKVHKEEIFNRVLKQWKEKDSISYMSNKNKLLGYRNV